MTKKRRSFTEQLFDSFINEKNLNKKNSIIFLILIFITSIIGVFLSISTKETEDTAGLNFFTSDYNIEILQNIGYSQSEIEEMDEDTLFNLANKIAIKTDNQIAGDPWNEELSYSESNDIKLKFYQYAISNNYEKIINEYEKLKSDYYLSQPYNQSLIRIYNDAYIINSVLSNKDNLIQEKDTLTKINDERMLLCLFLKSSINARNSTLKDRLSLTISNDEDNLKINSVTSSTMYYNAKNNLYKNDPYLTKMIDYINEGDFIVYKINFSLGLETFNAYMYKNLDSLRLEIYGIYADEKNTFNRNYVTVAESEEIASNVYNYNNSIKDVNNNLNSYYYDNTTQNNLEE